MPGLSHFKWMPTKTKTEKTETHSLCISACTYTPHCGRVCDPAVPYVKKYSSRYGRENAQKTKRKGSQVRDQTRCAFEQKERLAVPAKGEWTHALIQI